ncbi:hypothetical protein [Massilia aquatica]|uniref:Uncharacterized protein n=1 Tax=Massilia aquatica TaxID=2609000 RepID=A0ABX0MIY7_9BURK|nr:hypothetical protein [Massilia aquatica]NHZ44917.1 hypothetical protein [Massilia aquatica]
MTYCLGWRTRHGVAIIADSLLSAAQPDLYQHPEITHTTFGELQGKTKSKRFSYVAEEGLKLRVGSDFIVGFAGDVGLGRRLMDQFQIEYAAGKSLRDAATAALKKIAASQSDTTVLIGGYEGKKPVLLRIDTAPRGVSYVDKLVQIGSVPAAQMGWTAHMAEKLAGMPFNNASDGGNAERLFTPMIALVQSYGVHDNLVEQGIGGAFLGAWVTPDGAQWQRDALYAVHRADVKAAEAIMCGVSVRPRFACLISNQTDVVKIITVGKDDPGTSVTAEADEVTAQFDSALFDYVISINSEKHIVTVIEMKRSRHHRLLSLRPGDTGTIGITWTEQLIAMANTVAGVPSPDGQELTLYVIPFLGISPGEQAHRDRFAHDEELARKAKAPLSHRVSPAAPENDPP